LVSDIKGRTQIERILDLKRVERHEVGENYIMRSSIIRISELSIQGDGQGM
jgi:hypothetical protein